MHDANDPGRRPSGWGSALARLPAEQPPAGAWQRVAAALDAGHPAPRTRRRLAPWLAVAATVALAVALPWRQTGTTPDGAPPDRSPASDVATTGGAGASTTAALQAESALLETLLAHARDGRVASGSAAAITAELETRVAAIDAALADPALSPGREHALWRERVQALQALASFEGTRRWLAANGEHYDAALVQVN
ncbi:MAG TPA: hypothetical protein VFM73_01225 [Xanthomonadaceae bacterium]|nr:hypothetical protein [Xanthomonadaceae bacterium]